MGADRIESHLLAGEWAKKLLDIITLVGFRVQPLVEVGRIEKDGHTIVNGAEKIVGFGGQ